MDETPGRRAARWYAHMAAFFDRRADELTHQAERADAWAMEEVLREGAERSRRHAEWCRRAALAEMTPEDIADSKSLE